MSSFRAVILKDFNAFVSHTLDQVPAADRKDNKGAMLAQAFFWDEILTIAKKNSDAIWKELEKADIATREYGVGEYDLATSPSFVCHVKVSKPVQRFSGDVLADALLKSKYKVPLPITKGLIESSKVGGKSTYTFEVKEKG